MIEARLIREETVIEEGQPKLQHELVLRVPSTHYFAFIRMLAREGIVKMHPDEPL